MQSKTFLTPKQIEELLPRIGLSYHEIGRRTGKSDTTVRNVLLGLHEKNFSSAATKAAIHQVVREEIDKTIALLTKYSRRAA